MIPLFKVRTSPHIADDVGKTLNSGMLTQGPEVDKLERYAKKELRLSSLPTAVNSATSGLDLALDIIGVGPGDEVISTPMTCYATNVNILKRGAKIVWADVLLGNGNISHWDVARKVTDKTKAIMAVNWAGHFADYKSLKSFGIPVIEDAAHTWDAYEHNMPRGDYIVYSLQAIKFLTAGDGGLLVTPEEKRREARLKRWYGLDRDNNQSFRSMQDIEVLGYKYNMNDVAASIALSNIRYARNSVFQHKRNAKIMHEALSDLKFLAPLDWSDDASYWFFPISMNHGYDRVNFEHYMQDNGVQVGQVHTRNDHYSVLKEFKTPLHGLDFFAQQQTNLPCGWWLDQEGRNHIIETVRNYGKVKR